MFDVWLEIFIYSVKILSFILLACFGPPVTRRASCILFLFDTLILVLFKNAPFPVTVRWSKGQDIDAGCGQLATNIK